MVAVVGGVVFVWKKRIFTPYPIHVPIIEKRGDSIRWIFDKGRGMKDKLGIPQLELKNSRETMGYPAHEEFDITPKGKLVLPLYSPAKAQYQPIKVDFPTSSMKIIDKDILFWNILQHKKTDQIYPRKMGFWEKYASFLIVGFTAAILIFITIFVFNNMGEMTNALNGMSAAQERTAQIIADAGRPAVPVAPPIT